MQLTNKQTHKRLYHINHDSSFYSSIHTSILFPSLVEDRKIKFNSIFFNKGSFFPDNNSKLHEYIQKQIEQ